MKTIRITMGAARCAADLGDGSERGEYVGQDYILSRMGRPFRAVSLMYCYYPFDKQWPQRISEAMKDRKIAFQWDYPYDDYFPYLGGIGGSGEGEPFISMRDIRRHGQDVILTLTVDPAVTDEMLAAIGDDLRPYGRLLLRINHEATGNWFAFNHRASYREVADFYCRAARIIKEHAPNVSTVLCIGGVEDIENPGEMTREQEFSRAVRETDVWSVDKYPALHWGWPCDVAEPGGNSHVRHSVRDVYTLAKLSRKRFSELCGGAEKPMLMSEFNADGDVTGAYEQADMVRLFCDMLENDSEDWLSGICFYQFRDRGRLGLEIQDINDPSVGIEQPLMETVREIINRERFLPSMTCGEEADMPVTLRWGGAEDAEGIAIALHFDGDPVFCEAVFSDGSNLMLELNGRWFYKSPDARTVDLMPAFYRKRLSGETDMLLRIFAPPATGMNDLSRQDGLINYYHTLDTLPEIRIRTSPTELSKD